jgi:Dynein heavy chain, N-terminal region 1
LQALSESEQMRRDADDSGPYDEVEFWRATTAKYNSIMQLLSGHDCSMAIQILNIAKSKVLKVSYLHRGCDCEYYFADWKAVPLMLIFVQLKELLCRMNSDPLFYSVHGGDQG